MYLKVGAATSHVYCVKRSRHRGFCKLDLPLLNGRRLKTVTVNPAIQEFLLRTVFELTGGLVHLKKQVPTYAVNEH